MKQIHIIVATLVFHAVALASWTAAAGTETSNAWDAVQLKARTDHDNQVSYAIGEPIVFSLETTDVPPELDPALFAISWKRTGDDGRTETGRLPFVPGETGSVTTSLDRPGFVRLEARVVRTSDGKPVSRTRDAPGASSWSRDRKAALVAVPALSAWNAGWLGFERGLHDQVHRRLEYGARRRDARERH